MSQHSFPHDYRSGPWITAWDPSKWVILLLHKLGLVTGLRQARDTDVKEALAYMKHKSLHGVPPRDVDEESNRVYQYWTVGTARLYVKEHPSCCIILLNGWVVDATPYIQGHVSSLFSFHSVRGVRFLCFLPPVTC